MSSDVAGGKHVDVFPPSFMLFRHALDKKRKNSASSDDTASMIKGGGYLGARTRQPPIKTKLMWVKGVVCRSTRTQSLTVVACCLCYIAVHTLFL